MTWQSDFINFWNEFQPIQLPRLSVRALNLPFRHNIKLQRNHARRLYFPIAGHLTNEKDFIFVEMFVIAFFWTLLVHQLLG
jgi:hypothetical protein